MVQEKEKQPVLQSRQEAVLPLLRHCGPHRIHPQILNFQHRLALPAAAQDAPDPGNQLPWPEGLAHIILRPQLQPRDHAELIPRSRQENHREIESRLHRRAEGKAVAVFQGHIQKQKVKAFLLQSLKGLLLSFLGPDPEALRPEHRA